MCFDRNINGNRDVKFLIGIIGHCTDERNLLYESKFFIYVLGRDIRFENRWVKNRQQLGLNSVLLTLQKI